MQTIDLLALQGYAARERASAPPTRRRPVSRRIPPISGAGHIIRRPRLTRLLDDADSRLLLLVAPAGYGKTTLAREWVAARGRTGVWFRVTPTCTDPAALAMELAHVLDRIRPGVARHVADHLKVIDSPDVDVLGELLVETDEPWPGDAWLVVDDYHLVMPSPDAEHLLEVVCRAAERVLITSRERPTWVDARRLLYGEAFELGQSVLAMTHEEAETVLESAGRKPAGLVALANGWPAVIGLAALLPEEIMPTADVPAELHEFLAQELYNGLDVSTRRTLVLLSLPDTVDLEVVSLVDADFAAFLGEAETRGLLASTDSRQLEIHPLVRSFLVSKLSEHGAEIEDRVERLLNCLIERHQWDDAFTITEQMERPNTIRVLVAKASSDLLDTGRSATLEHWLSWAASHAVEGPEISLARAELLLRHGDWAAAESLAVACGMALGSDIRSAEGYLCAGRAAHLQDKPHAAQRYFQQALERDHSARIRRHALWGQFVCSPQIGPAATDEAKARLEELDDASPAHVLRIQQARLMLAQRRGEPAAASRAGLHVIPLVDLVDDPLARSGFLNALATTLRTAAYYDRSLQVARRLMGDGSASRLEFVVPHALWAIGAAKSGLGDYLGALADFERCRTHAVGVDHLLWVNSAVTIARTFMCQSDFDSARVALQIELLPELRDEMRGEVLATKALVTACLEDYAQSEALAIEALKFPDLGETRVMSAAARATIEVLRDGRASTQALDSLVDTILETGNYDGALCAFRAVPPLALAATAHAPMEHVLQTLVRRTGDAALAAATGIPAPPRERVLQSLLSRRELDVLRLTAQGLTNAAIANQLFISDKTVKTHLQNIYQKLGARSRTDAVVRAKENGLLGA